MFALSNSANTQPLYSNNSNNDITHNKKSDHNATKFTPDQTTHIDSKPLGIRSILKTGAALAASYYVGSVNGFTLPRGSNQTALATPNDLQENITSLGMNPNTTTRSESQISDSIFSDQWLKDTFKEHQADYMHDRAKRSLKDERGPCDSIRDKLVALWDKMNENCVTHWDKDKCDEARVEWSRGDAKYNLELLACREKCPTKKVYVVNKSDKKPSQFGIKGLSGGTAESQYIYSSMSQPKANKNCTFTMESLKSGKYIAEGSFYPEGSKSQFFDLKSENKDTTMVTIKKDKSIQVDTLKETPTEFWGEVDCGMTRSEEQYKKHGKKSQDCV